MKNIYAEIELNKKLHNYLKNMDPVEYENLLMCSLRRSKDDVGGELGDLTLIEENDEWCDCIIQRVKLSKLNIKELYWIVKLIGH